MADARLKAWLDALAARHALPDDAVRAIEGKLNQLVGLSTLATADLDAVLPTPVPAVMEPVLGERYTRLGLLGRGGTGEVWRVRGHVLDRVLAMKVLREEHAPRVDLVEEARAAARLRHPAIVTVHDVGVHPDGRVFYTMEEVQGRSLLDAIRERGVAAAIDADLRRLLAAVVMLAQGLAYAHDQGVVHRDVKPHNVVLGRYGEVRLLDFGVGVLGTPAYLAPEVATGATANARSDQYALGATLYHLIAGLPPYEDHEARGLDAVRAGPPTPLTGPAELVAIVQRAMHRDPARRFDDCAAVADALRAVLDGAKAEAQARQLLAEAASLTPDIARLQTEAAALTEQADRRLREIPLFAPVADKTAAWALQEAADARRAQAARTSVQVLQTLRAAERTAPGLSAVHEALADHFRARHEALTAARDPDADAALAWLETHDRGAHAAYVRGWGALTIRSLPAGATAVLYRLEERGRRRVPVFDRVLGTTPLEAAPVPHGDYLVHLVVRGHGAARVPVRVRRLEHVDVHGFGEPIPIPTGLSAHERYVPPGWFHAGTADRVQRDGMVQRRVWLDGFVLQRFPVTHAAYRAYLDCLLRSGRGEDALARAPQAAPGHPVMVLEGDRFRTVPDAEGDVRADDWPIFDVQWHQAMAYAAWQAAHTGQPWRLPGELEWEKAARGVDARRYPWGDAFEDTWCNMRTSGPAMSPGVNLAYPTDRGPYGVRGLAGNFSDWCLDTFAPDGPPTDDRGRWRPGTGMPSDADRCVARGGSWAFNVIACATTYRMTARPVERVASISFRLARSLTVADLGGNTAR